MRLGVSGFISAPLFHWRGAAVEPSDNCASAETQIATDVAKGQRVARTGTALLVNPTRGYAQECGDFFYCENVERFSGWLSGGIYSG